MFFLVSFWGCSVSESNEQIKYISKPSTNKYQISAVDYVVENSEQVPLSLVVGFSVTEENNIYLLDHTLRKIYKLSAKGEILQEISLTEGRGPGEFLRPASFAATEDNFFLFDQSNMKFVVTDSKLNLISEYYPKNNALNVIIQPLENNRFLGARNTFRLKKDEFTSFVFDYAEENIITEFDNSFSVHSIQPKSNSALNDLSFSLYANEYYYTLLSVPFVLKKFNTDKKLETTYMIQGSEEAEYFESEEGFLLPDIAHIGFSYNEYHNIFYTTAFDVFNERSSLYIFDENLNLNSIIDLDDYKISEDDLFQNVIMSNNKDTSVQNV